jgi:hypothetical protein
MVIVKEVAARNLRPFLVVVAQDRVKEFELGPNLGV